MVKVSCPSCHSDLTELQLSEREELVCPACLTHTPNPFVSDNGGAADHGEPRGDGTPPTRQIIVTAEGVQYGETGRNNDGSDGGEAAIHETPTFSPDSPQGPQGPSTTVPHNYEQDEDIFRNFGDYEIIDEVGRGAMGIVYRAQQKELHREVALKVLLDGSHASGNQVARFFKEAQAAARLRHPNIVPIHDIGQFQGRHYYTMDFIYGKSLGKLVVEGVISIRRALDLVIALAEALEYAHSQKVIHRDIKPNNILVDMDGNPQITDFGLAKRLDSGTKFTQTGSAIGTPAYMSPEQAAGESNRIDQRSDVYSLGAVLFELVTGQPPFEGENMMNIIMQVLNHDPPLPRSLNSRVHRDIQTIIFKALEKSPESRYQSMKEFADDLKRFLSGEAIMARPHGSFYRTWRKVRRHRTAVVAICFACIIAGASSVAVVQINEQRKREKEEKQIAVHELKTVKENEIRKTQTQEVVAVQEEFDKPVLPSIFKPSGKEKSIWSIKESELDAAATSEAVMMIDFGPEDPLKKNLKFEYTFRIISGAPPRVDCLIGPDKNRAYRLILNGDPTNPRLLLQRSGVNLAEVDARPLAANKTYRSTLERTGFQLHFEIYDGDQPVARLLYNDLDILRDLRTFKLGLALWDTHARFDSIKVTRDLIPQQPPLFYPPEQQILLGNYSVAMDTLSDIMLASYNQGNFEDFKARYLIGLCLELQGKDRQEKALEHYTSFPSSFQTENSAQLRRLVSQNDVRKFFCLSDIGDLSAAAKSLTSLSEKAVQIDPAWIWQFPGVIQRCLSTPRLEEALTIFQKARFQPDGRSLYELTGSQSKALYGKFVRQALTLGNKFSQGAHPNFERVIDVYNAFPDAQMTVAFENNLKESVRRQQVDAALNLLSFAGKKMRITKELTKAAVMVGDELCRLQQYQRVTELRKCYPVRSLASCYRKAVEGLLAQGERGKASAMFHEAHKAFHLEEVEEPDKGVDAALEEMQAAVASAFASVGDYVALLNIIQFPGHASAKLVPSIEAAISRGIEQEEYESVIGLLKVARERTLESEALNKETARLGNKLAEKQKVQVFQSLYNAYPTSGLVAPLLKLLEVCHDNEAYPNCLELLKFARDKLDPAKLKSAEERFDGFLLKFAAGALRRSRFQEVIAAHRAFPSEILLVSFEEAVKGALRTVEPENALQENDYDALVHLLPYARQHWPYPAAPALHGRLMIVAHQLASLSSQPKARVAEAGTEEGSPKSQGADTRAAAYLEQLLDGFTKSEAESAEIAPALHALTLEHADILLLAGRQDQAREKLEELERKLQVSDNLRGPAILRLASLVTGRDDVNLARKLWSGLAIEENPENLYNRIQSFVLGKGDEKILEAMEDKPLRSFIRALRAQLHSAEADTLRPLLEQSLSNARISPTWYTALAAERIARLQPPTSPAIPDKPATSNTRVTP